MKSGYFRKLAGMALAFGLSIGAFAHETRLSCQYQLLDGHKDEKFCSKEECAKAEAGFASFVKQAGRDPISFLMEAFHEKPVIFVGDIHTAAEHKKVLVDFLAAAEKESGFDFLVLEISSKYQEVIDEYLATVPENPSLLINNPVTLRDHWGASYDYLEIYRTVWKINQARNPEHRIRIVAADLPIWPPMGEVTESELARAMGERDPYMLRRLEDEILRDHPASHTLVFMGGDHGAKGGSSTIAYGNDAVVQFMPVQAKKSRLRSRFRLSPFLISRCQFVMTMR